MDPWTSPWAWTAERYWASTQPMLCACCGVVRLPLRITSAKLRPGDELGHHRALALVIDEAEHLDAVGMRERDAALRSAASRRAPRCRRRAARGMTRSATLRPSVRVLGAEDDAQRAAPELLAGGEARRARGSEGPRGQAPAAGDRDGRRERRRRGTAGAGPAARARARTAQARAASETGGASRPAGATPRCQRRLQRGEPGADVAEVQALGLDPLVERDGLGGLSRSWAAASQ